MQNDNIIQNNKKDIEKKFDSYNFFSLKFNDVNFSLIEELEKNINRQDTIKQINKYINNISISTDIEKGLFEYCISQIINKKMQHKIIIPYYYTELYNICNNLDENNTNINNKTLKKNIIDGIINPKFVAFLSPQQLHPDIWMEYSQKQKREDETSNFIVAYDDLENKCKGCGGHKFYSCEQQVRSADEPATKYVVCINCRLTEVF